MLYTIQTLSTNGGGGPFPMASRPVARCTAVKAAVINCPVANDPVAVANHPVTNCWVVDCGHHCFCRRQVTQASRGPPKHSRIYEVKLFLHWEANIPKASIQIVGVIFDVVYEKVCVSWITQALDLAQDSAGEKLPSSSFCPLMEYSTFDTSGRKPPSACNETIELQASSASWFYDSYPWSQVPGTPPSCNNLI